VVCKTIKDSLIPQRIEWQLEQYGGQPTCPSLLSSVCFFKSGRRSSTEMEIKRFLCSQSRGVGWGGRPEGSSKGRRYTYTHTPFMLRFDRKRQNSVKQLSFNKKINYI